jgi:hypothetical protein
MPAVPLVRRHASGRVQGLCWVSCLPLEKERVEERPRSATACRQIDALRMTWRDLPGQQGDGAGPHQSSNLAGGIAGTRRASIKLVLVAILDCGGTVLKTVSRLLSPLLCEQRSVFDPETLCIYLGRKPRRRPPISVTLHCLILRQSQVFLRRAARCPHTDKQPKTEERQLPDRRHATIQAAIDVEIRGREVSADIALVPFAPNRGLETLLHGGERQNSQYHGSPNPKRRLLPRACS